jgi:transcriptional regulator with XRE-family HTH domain
MDAKLAKTIGAEARRARQALGLTQEEAGERIGISAEFYARIERGGTLPSVPTLAKLAGVLGTTADALLGRPAVVAPEPPMPVQAPEVRRLLRRASALRPRAVRLLAQLAAELAPKARRPRPRQA